MGRASDFIIAGAPKSGTTFLTSMLAQHPGVHIMPRSPRKYGYFDQDHNFRRGRNWYLALNDRVPQHLQIGQTSASCHYHEAAPFRIAREQPETRIVLILRDPAARAYSHYNHVVRWHEEIHSFERALELEEARVRRGGIAWQRYSYFGRGKYREQLRRFEAAFPPEQLLVLQFEVVRREPLGIMERVCEFLGVDMPANAGCIIQDARTNPAQSPRFLAPRLLGYGLSKAGLWRVSQLLASTNLIDSRYADMIPATRAQLRRAYAEDVDYVVQRYGFERDLWN